MMSRARRSRALRGNERPPDRSGPGASSLFFPEWARAAVAIAALVVWAAVIFALFGD